MQYGLDPEEKSHRVYNFHRKTMDAAAEIVGTIGHDRFSDVSGEWFYFPPDRVINESRYVFFLPLPRYDKRPSSCRAARSQRHHATNNRGGGEDVGGLPPERRA